MSNINSLPSTSNSGNQPTTSVPKFMSLEDILKLHSNSGVKTRSSNTTGKLFQLDLQKKIDSSKSKLNMTRAYNLSTVDSFNFLEPPIKTEPIETDKSKHFNSVQINNHHHVPNEKLQRSNLKRDGKVSKKETRTMETVCNSYNDDPLKQIQMLTCRIDKDAQFDFEEEKNFRKKEKLPNFNCIHLPTDFNPEKGRLNVYKSGIIEVISNDNPPKIMRFKSVINGSNNVFTDLVFTTNDQVYIDQANLFSSESI